MTRGTDLPDAKTNTDWLQRFTLIGVPRSGQDGYYAADRPPIATEDAGGEAAQAATLP